MNQKMIKSLSMMALLFLFHTNLLLVENEKTVFLAILARNKAHTLPLFLKCISNLLYEKRRIIVYINTNDNHDATEKLLETWILEHENDYREIIYEKHQTSSDHITHLHEWNKERFLLLSAIREKSLRLCEQRNADFYFVVDCDNFIAPSTLQDLIAEDKPIIAPMLLSFPEENDFYSNFFAAVDGQGYYAHSPAYYDIFLKRQVGVFSVPVVHCTYLIKKAYLPFLSYKDDSSDHEFVIFSRGARKNQVKQYISNKKAYGFLVHFFRNISSKEEIQAVGLKLQNIQEKLFDSTTQ